MFGLDLNFTNKEEYNDWIIRWKHMYSLVTKDIKITKNKLLSEHKALSAGLESNTNSSATREFLKKDARNLMNLLQEAKERKHRITKMKKDVAEQPFPLEAECKEIDIHYNKISNEYEWMPRWVVKAKGASYYVNGITCNKGFSTKNKEGSTRGLFRFKNSKLFITEDGQATIK